MAEKQDAFTKATEAAAEIIRLDGVIKEAQARRKAVRADLAKHKKAVLVAMGSGKVRASRKVKVAPLIAVDDATGKEFPNGD